MYMINKKYINLSYSATIWYVIADYLFKMGYVMVS